MSISAFDDPDEDDKHSLSTKRLSDATIEYVPDPELGGSKKVRSSAALTDTISCNLIRLLSDCQLDSKATPHWIAASSSDPQRLNAEMQAEDYLKQQREFMSGMSMMSRPSLTSSHNAAELSSGTSPTSVDGFAPGSHQRTSERRGTRTRSRPRSRSKKDSSGKCGGRWTSQEEETLKQAHSILGDDWAAISEQCFGSRDGRTADHCQARWEKVVWHAS